MITWLKTLALGTAIRQLDQLEPIFAAKIKESQGRLGALDAAAVSKKLVDEVQKKLCQLLKLDPEKVL